MPGVKIGRIWGVVEPELCEYLRRERGQEQQYTENAEWLELRKGYQLELLALGRSETTVAAHNSKINDFSRWCSAKGV